MSTANTNISQAILLRYQSGTETFRKYLLTRKKSFLRGFSFKCPSVLTLRNLAIPKKIKSLHDTQTLNLNRLILGCSMDCFLSTNQQIQLTLLGLTIAFIILLGEIPSKCAKKGFSFVLRFLSFFLSFVLFFV